MADVVVGDSKIGKLTGVGACVVVAVTVGGATL